MTLKSTTKISGNDKRRLKERKTQISMETSFSLETETNGVVLIHIDIVLV